MKVFGQYWFLQGLVTACMLFGISAACEDASDCNAPNGACTEGKCVCETDFAGPTCALANPCIGETCSNHGECAPSEDDSPVAVCTCETGYTGTECETDIDECIASGDDAHDCDENAVCTNTPAGSYTCTCNEGFVGDGKTCTDIDECIASGDDVHDCDENAVCTNTPAGSYTCTCNEGFVGDGKTCTEGVCSKDGEECLNGGTCDTSSTPSTCSCADGYTGDTCQSGGGTVKISAYLMGMTVLTFFVIL